MLTAHHLTKSYGLTPILKNISFSVNAGDRIGLIGPNGCGKSTLLRILAGEETAVSGHITLTPPTVQIGYLSQGFNPDPVLTIPQAPDQTITSKKDAKPLSCTSVLNILTGSVTFETKPSDMFFF